MLLFKVTYNQLVMSRLKLSTLYDLAGNNDPPAFDDIMHPGRGQHQKLYKNVKLNVMNE